VSPRKVPTHLNQPDGIGKFSLRQIALAGGSFLYIVPTVWDVLPKDGPALGAVLRTFYPGLGWLFGKDSLPIIPLLGAAAAWAPFLAAALPLDPPVEHGLLAALRWALKERGYQTPEAAAKDLGLRLADAAEVEQAEDHWGEFLSGLTAPVQTLARATRVDPERIVGRIEQYTPARNSHAVTGKAGSTPATNARKVAAWLRSTVRDRHLIERRHFLTAMAHDEQAYIDSEQEIADALDTLGFRSDLVRRLEGDELREVIQATWSSKMPKKKRLGPLEKPFNAHDA
jgi:hypothetical protein